MSCCRSQQTGFSASSKSVRAAPKTMKNCLRTCDHSTTCSRRRTSWARQRGANAIDREDVATAISERRRRLSRIQSRTIDAIKRNTLLIDTSGEQVGQVNGLSVVDLGEFRFGHPVRITATTRIGTGQVVGHRTRGGTGWRDPLERHDDPVIGAVFSLRNGHAAFLARERRIRAILWGESRVTAPR